MSIKIILFFIIFSLTFSSFGQVEGINLNTEEATRSYTLFNAYDKVYLIDNCGDIVHEWQASSLRHHAKLLPNGDIIYIEGGWIFRYNWEGASVAQLTDNDPEIHLEYEVIILPNGNYLCVGRKNFSHAQFAEIGYWIPPGSFPTEIDVVVELDQVTGNIVWEWDLADHVIQERDPNAPNYGVLKDNPQLLNTDAILTYDWENTESFMINGMDYNPDLDQIILSVRKLSELVIIDHSTTTAEAAGHSGGLYGKGGDILWRWGNPANYDCGTTANRSLFFEHNPKWITKGPHVGKISCYNNGLNRPNTPFGEQYSEVLVLAPQMDANWNYMRDANGAFLPAAPELNYGKMTTNTPFYSGYTSGAEFMANGNVYITNGYKGRLMEINSSGDVVWRYTVPNTYYIFRSEKYPLNYAAFSGRDLTPSGQLTGVMSDYECMIIDALDEPELPKGEFKLSQVGHSEYIITNKQNKDFYYRLHDIRGVEVFRGKSIFAAQKINLNELVSGLYILSVVSEDGHQWLSFKLLKN